MGNPDDANLHLININKLGNLRFAVGSDGGGARDYDEQYDPCRSREVGRLKLRSLVRGSRARGRGVRAPIPVYSPEDN